MNGVSDTPGATPAPPAPPLKVCKAHVAAEITISDLDDEWLLVSLLADLTRMERVACRVTDSDGEFLLVDAADHLPDWLEPDSRRGADLAR